MGLSEENLRLDRRLYLAEPAEVIHNAGADANCLSVVGHDPGFEGLVTKLTGHVEPFPTAALAVIRLSINSWRSLEPKVMGQLQGLWRPRDLG